MKNKQLLDGALASIKAVRKNLGGVTMIGQAAEELGANADSIVNSSTSFLFLKDANRPASPCLAWAISFLIHRAMPALFSS
jgi:hypothetical protein